jgi:hypothetical protein
MFKNGCRKEKPRWLGLVTKMGQTGAVKIISGSYSIEDERGGSSCNG